MRLWPSNLNQLQAAGLPAGAASSDGTSGVRQHVEAGPGAATRCVGGATLWGALPAGSEQTSAPQESGPRAPRPRGLRGVQIINSSSVLLRWDRPTGLDVC